MNLFKEKGWGMGQPKGRAAAWRQGGIVLVGGQLPGLGVSSLYAVTGRKFLSSLDLGTELVGLECRCAIESLRQFQFLV